MNIRYLVVVVLTEVLFAQQLVLAGQATFQPQGQGNIPISTQWLLESVRTPQQRDHVKAVLMLVCSKTKAKGTAFLLKNGIVVTNEHVVSTCSKGDLWAQTSMGRRVTFASLVADKDRDLALLLPVEQLEGGLELGGGTDVQVEDEVSTWGYPLDYETPAPLFSNGYVAGSGVTQIDNRTVRRLIINGAFNPGNSGGPLILKRKNTVIGVVVEKWTLRSPLAEAIIQGFIQPGAVRATGNFRRQLPDGSTQAVSDQEAIGTALAEFYKRTQVMIGEAISVAELRDFVQDKEAELRANTKR